MSQVDSTHAVEPYEKQLDSDRRWADMEGDRHFNESSRPFLAMRKISRRLDELGIAYAVVGGMALNRHGLRRFTDDVDILVTPEALKTIHERLVGLGYLPPHGKSKHLRDTELGVKIEFLTTGDYPGDGKPKPVAFPDPKTVDVEVDGIRFVKLETLIELKLASGISSAGRQKDLGDAQELMRVLNLPRELGEGLNPYVQPEYFRLWDGLRSSTADDEEQ
jgi:hypothetical protein